MDEQLELDTPALQDKVASTLDALAGDGGQTSTEQTTHQEIIEQWPKSPLAEHISNQVLMVFGAKVAPNWNLSDEEKLMISAPLAQIITAWLPTSPDQQMNPYIAFLGGCALVAGGRAVAGIPMQKPEKTEKEKYEDEVYK